MRVLVVGVVLASVTGCLFDPVVPAATPLSCSVDADCPGGDVCAVGRCTPVEALRGDAAVTSDVLVAPGIVGRGGVVDVTFTVAAALSAPPTVTADVGRVVGLERVADPGQGDDGGRFHFRYTVDGSEAGGEATVGVNLTDAVGRVVTAPLGTFVVDLVTPTFAEAVLVEDIARLGTVVGADALLDAPAEVTARAIASDGTTLPLSVSVEGLRVRARAAIDSTVPAGPLTVILAATDAAGNDSGDVVVGEVVVDLVAPDVVVTATPTVVRPRDLVRFIVTASEPVAAPALRVDGEALIPDVAGGSVLSWSWLVPDAAGDGAVDETVEVVVDTFADAAGNERTLPPWNVAVDARAPNLIVLAAPAAQARAGDAVAATFAFSEPAFAVTVQAQRFDDTFSVEVDDGDGSGTFRIDVPAESFASEGRYDLVVTARDAVGNEARELMAAVVVDARPPTLLAATFTPASARLGSTVTLQSTFSEPLRSVDGVVDLVLRSNAVGLQLAGVSGNTVTHTLAIDATTPAVVTLDGYVAADLAGNVTDSTSPIATLAVDNVAPRLGALTAVAPRVARRAGSTIEIVGDAVDPDGSAAPEVVAEFNGRREPCTVVLPSALRCTIAVGVDDSDGTQPVVITARDVAGNTASGTVIVTLDGTGPVVLNATFSAARARPGSAVQLTVLADEVIADIELGLSTGAVELSPGTSSLSRTVVVPASGPLELTTIRVSDDLGNERQLTLAPAPAITVDGAAPAITGSALSTNLRRSDAARAGDVVIADFDVELPLLEDPTFTFGGESMAIIDDDGAGHFTASHTLTGTEVEGGTIVTVTAVDDVGNVAFARSANTILVDLTPPTVIDGTVQVAVSAPPGAPVQFPAAVGVGGTARVSWLVGEPTVAAPTLVLGGAPIAPAGLVTSGAAVTVTLPSAALQDGSQQLRARHEDVVGNAATVDIALLTADLVPPAPLSIAERALFLHERAPHGSINSQTPFQAVRVRPLAGRQGQTVSVAADAGDVVRIASAVVASGPFTLDLDRDREDVFVQVYDEAGNRAAGPGPRPRSEFIAGFHGKVAGSLSSNPHRLEVRRHFTAVATDPSATELDGDLVALRDSLPFVVDAAGLWQESGPQVPPTARSRVAATTHQGTLVMFGGCGEDGPVAETWAFDGRGWKAVFGEDDVIPPARCGAGIASDDQRLFVFGGEGFSGLLNDLWMFDGRNWKEVPSIGAPPTSDMAMGYDPRADALVLYGGATGGGVVGDLYRVPAGGGDWALEGTGPVVSSAASVMRDGILVVVGGLDNRARGLQNILTVDGPTVTEVGSLTAPRSRGCALVVNNAVVVLGGVVESSPVETAVRIDGATPTEALEFALPGPRSGAACGLSGPTPLIFGGTNGTGQPVGDTLRFEEGWRPIEAATDLPTPRSHAAFARRGDATLTFGGSRPSDQPSDEIWEFVETWKFRGTLPIDVERAGAACLGSRCLVVGGFDKGGLRVADNQVVEFNGAATVVPTTGLTPRTNPAVAASDADGVVLFGGATAAGLSGETCELANLDAADKIDWTCAVVPGPTASAGAVMTTGNGLIILYAAGQLWQWNKDLWMAIGTKDGPPARQFPAVAVDEEGGRLWLHGGVAGATRFDDVWSYDIAADVWRQHLPADPFDAGAPDARAAHVAHFDGALGRVMVFGGEDATGAFGDMWDFLPSPDARAGLLVRVDTTLAPGATQAFVRAVGDVTIEGAENTGSVGEPTASFPLFSESGSLVVPIVARASRLTVDAIEVRLIRP